MAHGLSLCSVRLSITLLAIAFLPGTAPGSTDEVLAVVPSHAVAAGAASRMHLYQHLGEMVLVGAERGEIEALRKAGIDAVIVDETPWTATYAVVAQYRGRPGQLPDRPGGGRILFRWNDLTLIKTNRDALSQLRKEGFACVEVRRVPLPAPGPSLRLPPSGQTRNDSVAAIIAVVSETSVAGYIQGLEGFGTRVWSRTNRDSVFSFVRHRFLEAGIADVRLDSFQYGGTWQANVVATIPGTVHPESEIIVGGHLDSQNFSNPNAAPGADDNATGTAAALEMARVLMETGYQPAFTLRFIGFAAEEAGLIGGFHYAGEAAQRGDDIRVMMNYDMLGYRNQGMSDRDFDIVWYTGSEAYSDLHAVAAQTYTTLTPVLTTSFRSGSDSWAFYQNGFHSLFCIEDDFNPYYHSANDLLQYLDIPYATDIIRSGLATLLILDQQPPEVEALEVLDSGDGESLLARWDVPAEPDIVGYNVYIGTSPGVYDEMFSEAGNSHLLSGLAEGVAYYVGVSAVDLVGREGMVVEVGETPLVVPRIPIGLAAVQGMDGLDLSWFPNRELDIDGYYVYRSADSLAPFTRMNTEPLTGPSWTDSSVTPAVYYYCVTAVDQTGNESAPSDTVAGSLTVSIGELPSEIPAAFRLSQNYPNPFNSSTQIRFAVPRESSVVLRILNILGEEVALLVEDRMGAGIYSVEWNAADVGSGVYFLQLHAGGVTQTKKMILIK